MKDVIFVQQTLLQMKIKQIATSVQYFVNNVLNTLIKLALGALNAKIIELYLQSKAMHLSPIR